jgi:hypothetical protein
MEAKEFDFEFPRGDTCPISFTLTDSEGSPLDLSTSEIYFTMKKSYSTQDYILQKKKSTYGITVDGNKCALILSHNDTAQLSYGNYVYDIQVKSGDYVKTLVLGTITLTNESTWKANE